MDALLDAGDEVLVLDDLSSGKRENLDGALSAGAELTELDVSDSAALGPAVEGFGPEAVFHLAAQIDVRRSMADPGFDARLNVVGTLNALEAATRSGAGRFLFTSTGGAIYGEGEGREDDCRSPRAPPASRSRSTARASSPPRATSASIAACATSAPWRCGSATSTAPARTPPSRPGWSRSSASSPATAASRPCSATASQTRDYVHVADVVAALLAARESDAPGPFNVGTGVETTVLQLAEQVGALAGRDDFEPEFAPARDGEVERTALDTSLAAKELGFKAERDLAAGLEQTISDEG